MSNENNSYIAGNGVNHVSPASFAWPDWVSPTANTMPVEPLSTTAGSDCVELSGQAADAIAEPDGAQQDAEPEQPMPVNVPGACRCGSTRFLDFPIHDGQSIRRDCAQCRRFVDFVLWYGRPSEN
jgi:hypothetical protein